MARNHTLTCLIAAAVCFSCKSGEQTSTWTGGGDAYSWSNAKNWEPARVPNDARSIIIESAIVTITTDTRVKASQRVEMSDAVIQLARGVELVNDGAIELENSAISSGVSTSFVNNGSVGGTGTVATSCGGGAAPDAGDVASSVFIVVCAVLCDPADFCCDPGEGPTGCTHLPTHWQHAADWPAPLTQGDLLCGAGLEAILRADELDDLESDSSDSCSESNSASESSPDLPELWFQLAHEYIAAIINQASGASSTARVDMALDEARVLLETNCTSLPASQSAYVLDLTAVLADYNVGLTGPGACEPVPFTCPEEVELEVVEVKKPHEACFDTGFGNKCITVTGIETR